MNCKQAQQLFDERFDRQLDEDQSRAFDARIAPFVSGDDTVALPQIHCFYEVLSETAKHPSLIAATYWPQVRRIPAIGPVMYFLPGFALATLPFALDFTLMFGR